MKQSAFLFGVSLMLIGCHGEDAAHDDHGHANHQHAGHDHAQHEHAGHDHAQHAMQDESPGDSLDGQSLFQLDDDLSLVDQTGESITLRSLESRPTLVTFFYGGCTTMCPLIVHDVRRIVNAMPESERSTVNVVLVTIDPERDTPARLRELAGERGMPAEWRLIGGDPASIRTLASTLGMRYRELADGSFAHNALYTVLDPVGRVARQLEGTGRPVDELVLALRPRS